jgi:hypothetical protein
LGSTSNRPVTVFPNFTGAMDMHIGYCRFLGLVLNEPVAEKTPVWGVTEANGKFNEVEIIHSRRVTTETRTVDSPGEL